MDKKYIIGVSGGPDSMCLLDKYKKHIELVCHVNYKKRPTVNRDETIVRDYCKSNHLKVKVLNVTKAIYHKYQKLYGNNFQNIARLIRYDFFLKNGTNVLIAHNKDDFIETALMQLKRKTKSLFLGIHKKSLYKTLHIFRPLLNKRKNELQKYCDQHNIIYGIDESNLINIYQRNKLRKEINKWSIKKFNKTFDKISSFNKKNQKKQTLINQQFNKWEGLKFSTKFNLNEYLIYQYLLFINESNINSQKINSLIRFIKSNKGNIKFRLSSNHFIVKKNHKIRFI